MKTVTKNEVAKTAGVSHMTVTRVLNDHSYVSDTAREKVLKACEELSYRPNKIASSLRSRKSHALGVIVPTFKHTFYSRFLNSVERTCGERGYHIINIQTRKKEGEKSGNLEWEPLEFLLERQIDGLIIIESSPSRKIIEKLKKENIPVVFADVPPQDDGFPFVGTADFEGGRKITSYLVKCGHRSIAFIAGQPGHYTSEERIKGFKAALREMQVPFKKEFLIHSDYSTEGGFQAAEKLVSSGKHFSAIVCANDYIAIGALSALHNNGIKVPDKVSVTGFTGDEIGAFTVPPLTTMVQLIEESGRKSVEMLLSKISHPERPVERILINAELLERGSVRKL